MLGIESNIDIDAFVYDYNFQIFVTMEWADINTKTELIILVAQPKREAYIFGKYDVINSTFKKIDLKLSRPYLL